MAHPPEFRNFEDFTPPPIRKDVTFPTIRKDMQIALMTMAHNHAGVIASRCVDYLSNYQHLKNFASDPYVMCFGKYDKARFAEVKLRFELIRDTLMNEMITYVRDDEFNMSPGNHKTIAYVNTPWNHEINICAQKFFGKMMGGIKKNFKNTWTPVSTIIHEVAHCVTGQNDEGLRIDGIGDSITVDIKFGPWEAKSGTKVYGLRKVTLLADLNPEQTLNVADCYGVFADLAVKATYEHDIKDVDFRNLLP